MTRYVWAAVLAFMAAGAWAAQVYRTVGPDGTVTYSDRPAGETAESIFIASRRSAPTPSQPPAPRSDAANSAGEATTEVQRERREPTPEERAEDRARNCAIAREREERYAISHRLYREAPDGEREYLTDAELTEARAKATADVHEWCD